MFEIKVDDIEVVNDKHVLSVNIDESFKSWFISFHGLKRWNHMKFRKIFLNALSKKGFDYKSAKIKVNFS